MEKEKKEKKEQFSQKMMSGFRLEWAVMDGPYKQQLGIGRTQVLEKKRGDNLGIQHAKQEYAACSN